MSQPSVSNPLGSPFVELQSVDSSNNYAMARAHEGMTQHGTAYFAHEQTAGKGQRDKTWTAEKGLNISITLVIHPEKLLLSRQFELSACIAVAAQQFFSKYAGDDTKIKWPNDIYWGDRKAAGILIENIIGSSQLTGHKWQWAIVGIGININQTIFPKELPNPVSLKQITGQDFNTVALAKELCSFINTFYEKLSYGEFEFIYDLYNLNLYKKNEVVKIKKDTRVFEVVIQGVAENGQLITQHAIEERFDFGEVEWI